MDLKSQNILFITRTMGVGGTENVILQLCEILQPYVNKIIVCSCGGVNVEKILSMGINHYYIPDISEKTINNIAITVKTIKNIIKNEEITVVHSHHRMAALYSKILVSNKIPRIINIHNTFSDKKLLTKFSYSGAKLIAVGEQVSKNIQNEYKIHKEKITIINNSSREFKGERNIVEELKKSKEEGYILIGNIGRLSKQKGMEYFIKAAAMMIKRYSKVRFYIIGDGEDYTKLRNLADKILPKDALVFMGYREDIQNIMSQLDFIVLSSLWEGLPLTPIEAFSVGRTIIATNVDGTSEIVNNEVNGLLVEPKNENELCKAMLKLCKDKELLKILEKGAVNTYKNKFSFEKLTNKYLDFYNSINI